MSRDWKRSINRMVRGTAATLLAVCATGGLLFGGLAVSEWTSTSPVFNLDSIVIEGNRTVATEEILKVSGLARGSNILSVDLEKIEKRLLLDRRFDRVALIRRMPNTMVVEVKEHRPIAFVQLDGLYGVSRGGELIPLSQGKGLPDIPVITVGTEGMQQALDAVNARKSNFESLRDAMLANPELGRALYLIRVMKTLSPGMYDQMSEVHVSRENDPVVYMVDGGLAIRFGTGNYPRKIEMLKRTVDRLETDAIKTRLIDLRFKDQVIVRPIVSNRSTYGRT